MKDKKKILPVEEYIIQILDNYPKLKQRIKELEIENKYLKSLFNKSQT